MEDQPSCSTYINTRSRANNASGNVVRDSVIMRLVGGKPIAIQHQPEINLESSQSENKMKKSYTCNECNKSVFWKKRLIHHMQMHFTGVSFENSKVKRVRKLNRLHPKQNHFKCAFCERTFHRRYSVTRHIKDVHAEAKRFQCYTCDTEFSQKANLERHMRVHDSEKPFECAECKQSFSQKSNRNRHIKRKHTVKSECDNCKKINKK